MVWAPSTPVAQGYLVPHLTYDSYFWKGPVAGTAGSPIYPIDTGITMGVLPFQKLNLELGFDLLLPSEAPLILHGKLAVPEEALFRGQPGASLGIFGAGTKRSGTGRTDYDMAYLMVGKTVPRVGGVLAIGGYYALHREPLARPDGTVSRSGLLAGVTGPDIRVRQAWLEKIVIAADVQTGRNAFSAAGLAAAFYFSPAVALLTGPIRFFEPSLQPGGSQWAWTVQVDVDMDLRSAPPR